LLNLALNFESGFVLLLRVIVDDGSVLDAKVVALLVFGSRIVECEEMLYKILVGAIFVVKS